MTPAGEILQARIAHNGPLRFSEFMETALYAPGAGYYAARRDPFGREGDFYTASQLQPVFGRLIAQALAPFKPSRVLDWGGGRGEMKESLAARFPYLLIEHDAGPPEPQAATAIFANELFDALPVDVARRSGRVWRAMKVASSGGKFIWHEDEPLEGEWLDYAEQAGRHLPNECEAWIELPVACSSVLEKMSRAAPTGTLLAIDYGYTAREILRFPRGSLMAYRKHLPAGDVLAEPGAQDITAHVPWTYLESVAARFGWRRRSFEPLSSLLMKAGEADQFAAALDGGRERHTLQLKTLLFGMGESFQAITMERTEAGP